MTFEQALLSSRFDEKDTAVLNLFRFTAAIIPIQKPIFVHGVTLYRPCSNARVEKGPIKSIKNTIMAKTRLILLSCSLIRLETFGDNLFVAKVP